MRFRRKNIRLNALRYRGHEWFFITLCCEFRHRVFVNREWAERLVGHLKSTATKYNFSVHAYCAMPDHFHALVEGLRPDSDLLIFLKTFKQSTSREYSSARGAPLWQKKFYDHILRPKDSPDAMSWYIWMNPVRKGLCSQPNEYPYSGSFTEHWETKSQPQAEWIPARSRGRAPHANPAASEETATTPKSERALPNGVGQGPFA